MYYLKIGLLILYQPETAFNHIKRSRKTMPVWVPLLLYFLALSVKVLSILWTHFPLAEARVENTNIGETVISVIVPLMSLVGGIYLITAIRDGETTFFETFTAVAFSLLPYILLTLPITALSRILTLNEAGLFQFLNAAVLIWCAVLIIYSVGHLNTYTFGQTIVNCILAVLAVLFIWAVVILLWILGEKLVGFITEVITEYRLLGKG